MKENIDISVIIPVYNASALIDRCLDSVLSQNGEYELESYTEDKDIEEMYKVIVNLSSEPENLNNMALFSIEKTQRLSLENIVPQWIQLFNN